MNKYKTDHESCNSPIATIFFLPKRKGEMIVGNYNHCGIMYDNKIYEIIDGCGYCYQKMKAGFRLVQLKLENAVFLETKIFPEKIEQEIISGTNNVQFVLRVMGMSNLKGADKGSLQPSDVYKMIQRKKHDR
jgi:hypothetical protein